MFRRSVPCSETRTLMTLFSAYEDFVNRTLGPLEGTWERLVFVAGLRGEKDRYEHWGLEYTYGPKAARAAITQAHTEFFQKVMETPITTLHQEFTTELKRTPVPPDTGRMIPEERNGCSPEHFRYVMSALNLLAESRSNRQAA